jgi:hypothetical protein
MTATPTPPPAAEPAGDTSATPTPAVPYGPPVGQSDASVPDAAVTIDLSSRSVAGTAGKWALRLLLPLVLRAIFRAVFR